MIKNYLLFACFLFGVATSVAQDTRQDSLPPLTNDDLLMDTSINYDELMDEFDLFLDSLLAPRSYFLANLSVSQGYFNFIKRNPLRIEVTEKNVYTPSVGYYSKSGLGITVAGNIVNDSQRLNLYQVSLSPSYDYLKNRNMALGFSYTRHFTKDSLSFYVSPLQNELNGYFIWRKSWLQPGITAGFGWGSRTAYKERLRFLERLKRRVLVITTTEESVTDFSLTASLRHNFYWLNIFSKKDFIRLTPQLAFSAGSQNFGFNQTTGTYGVNRLNLLYNSGNLNLDNERKFQPLSMTLYLRSEYSVGKFYLQPQFMFDYYFPAENDNFNVLFSVNAGIQL
ncbi:MAG: hypothetical protein JNN00_12140 [Chitinophagaceae bacterium]|nr:hypothetical protein [Chitinophagaceae bacterium]